MDEGRAELQRVAPRLLDMANSVPLRSESSVRAITSGRTVQPYRSECPHRGRDDHSSPDVEFPVLCHNVTVRGVTINSHGRETAAIRVLSRRLIDRCVFDTGDDDASSPGAMPAGVASTFERTSSCGTASRDGHGGVTIGSEISGVLERVRTTADGQPKTRSRAPPKKQRDAWRRASRHLHA
jgi:hypothetical protein